MAWLENLKSNATNSPETSATNKGGSWVEQVKVKKWYSFRLMRWDATNKAKVYVKYIGNETNAQNDPIYGSEARRLVSRRLAVSGGTPSPDSGTRGGNAEGGG